MLEGLFLSPPHTHSTFRRADPTMPHRAQNNRCLCSLSLHLFHVPLPLSSVLLILCQTCLSLSPVCVPTLSLSLTLCMLGERP